MDQKREIITAIDPSSGERIYKRTLNGHRFIVVAQHSADTRRELIGFRCAERAERHCLNLVSQFDYAAAYVLPAQVEGGDRG